MEFFIPKAEVIFEEEIKKSRFITYIRHTEGMEQAKAFWAEIRALHPHARHHCWATVAGQPNDSQQYGFLMMENLQGQLVNQCLITC